MARSRFRLILSVILLAGAVAACGTEASGPVELRLAHFPNLTHGAAIFALEKGIFTKALGDELELDVKTFNAGPDVVQAIFSDDIDIAFIGPNPAVNAFQKSQGEAVRVVAGAASGGAALVVRPGISTAGALRGKTLATPQLGNTQDVALRAWLTDQGLTADTHGGGDVSIRPQENAQALQTFRSGQIDGAWVPEPWVTRLVSEGKGKVLVDEATLWPDGKYVTTLVLVRAAFLEEHADVVERFLAGHVEAIGRIADDPTAAATVNDAIAEITGKALPDEVLLQAWEHLDFTYDPLVGTIERSAADAKEIGLLDDANVAGIADVTVLNRVLQREGKEPVEAA